MRFIYADPGLRNDVGHHGNFCRIIRGELIRRGIQVVVLAHIGITDDLLHEVEAKRLFRVNTYYQSDGDPIAGWLNAFQSNVQATVADLNRLGGFTADDIFYFASVQPAQFMALVTWIKSLPAERRPRAIVEFATGPGVDFVANGANVEIRPRDYRLDPRPMFYRHAAGQLTETDLARFHMITFHSASTAAYVQVLGKPVHSFPPPTVPPAAVAGRVGRRPVTVAVIGHQRPDKGYHLVPDLARLLLASEPEIRLLAHNSAPDEMAGPQAGLRALAAAEPRLILNEQSPVLGAWNDLLARCGLLLCPYEPARYVASHSGILMEAMANAIPIVLPGGTALSRQLAEFGNPGAAFEHHTVESIVAAVRKVLADYDGFAARAMAAAQAWNATMGVKNMVAGLLALGAADDPPGSMPPLPPL
jgi:glycosyltransferase involved in cell wall biosynthesis